MNKWLGSIVSLLVPSFLLVAGQALADDVKPVTVVNTPLPVAGTLTGNVSVTGGSVSVTGTTQVRNVENPARHPFANRTVCQVAAGGQTCQATIDVPVGKELVVETISTFAVTPPGTLPFAQLSFTTNRSFATGFAFPLSFVGSFAGQDGYVSTQSARAYADPGSTLLLQGTQTTFTGNARFDFTVTGYLVDCGAGAGCPAP